MEVFTKKQIITYLENQDDLEMAISNIGNFSKYLKSDYREPEIWEDINGYGSKYKISSHGRIKTFLKYSKGKFMTPITTKDGYLKICLGSKPEKTHKSFRVHVLVATIFIPNPNNLPAVNHKDGNKANNYYKNLEWCTYGHNNKHAYDIGIREAHYGENNSSAKLTNNEVEEIYKIILADKHKIKEIAKMFNITSNVVSCIKHKRTWSKITDKLDTQK